MLARLAIDDIVNHHLHLSVQVALALVMGNDSLLRTVEGQTLTLGTWTNLRDVVQTKHHIL